MNNEPTLDEVRVYVEHYVPTHHSYDTSAARFATALLRRMNAEEAQRRQYDLMTKMIDEPPAPGEKLQMLVAGVRRPNDLCYCRGEGTCSLCVAKKAKDAAYRERDQCVALIAKMALALGYRVGLAQHPADDTAWENDWRTIVFIDLPSGQVSWHIHDSERSWFDGLPDYPAAWDGHSTPEKYQRVLAPLHGKEEPATGS